MNRPLNNARSAQVLLVEDNDDDFELTRIAFASVGHPVLLHRVRNGEECLAFLRGQGVYANLPSPDLVLLDLNMPRLGGAEVLAQVAADELLRHFPIVVLTTSSADEDVWRTYRLRCSSYILKPLDFDQFERAIQVLADYWFTVAVLPGERRMPGERRKPGD